MNNKVSNIVSILLILIMLPASSGVSVYHHICSMEGTHNISLYSETTCHHEDDHSCCHSQEANKDGCSFENHDHCISFVEYFSIDNDYTSSSRQEIKLYEYFLPYEIHSNNVNTEQERTLTGILYKKDFKLPVVKEISFILRHSLNTIPEDQPSDLSFS
jgi:hypothetical protein